MHLNLKEKGSCISPQSKCSHYGQESNPCSSSLAAQHFYYETTLEGMLWARNEHDRYSSKVKKLLKETFLLCTEIHEAVMIIFHKRWGELGEHTSTVAMFYIRVSFANCHCFNFVLHIQANQEEAATRKKKIKEENAAMSAKHQIFTQKGEFRIKLMLHHKLPKMQ